MIIVFLKHYLTHRIKKIKLNHVCGVVFRGHVLQVYTFNVNTNAFGVANFPLERVHKVVQL